MKKKIAALLMAGMMALSMVGCGGSKEPATAQTNEDGSVDIRDNNLYFVKIGEKTYKVGAKIADLEKDGYTMSDKRRDETLPSNRYSMDTDMKKCGWNDTVPGEGTEYRERKGEVCGRGTRRFYSRFV